MRLLTGLWAEDTRFFKDFFTVSFLEAFGIGGFGLGVSKIDLNGSFIGEYRGGFGII